MVPIYICEDQRHYQEMLAKQISQYCLIKAYDLKIISIANRPEETLDRLKENPQLGIYFLDVDLKDKAMDGFQLGEAIRKLDPRGFIIYVTTHGDLSFETFNYRIEAMDYILKDEVKALPLRIRQCLDSVVERLYDDQTDAGSYFSIKIFNEVHHILVTDILYFETSSNTHRILLHGTRKQLEFFGKLSEIETRLGESFIRSHRSYLVNRDYIRAVDYNTGQLRMANEGVCLMSRKMRKFFQTTNQITSC
ncbi:LytTR family DNA-binding domain-containing protein [uncultured Vagococcus sp.]|uniref:LytR/AlgR family response regulator transcription factor n=1 Tax=uncultured Vagococcus sp. TaxID=189676 RepID=UPI0028D8B919|nr:LytTR family DNA-binding domain-containing protein [uncultured Vagococcus sp.]